ncbi:alpha/beta hydrolase [Thiomonas bhubaneswarensis]|uniref:Alpha/beta hydrolase family n=1 Tax=Thiomonas bhubaneswarensis TaxID=339866 RepID=A0A0K6I4F6_9BURK|nr:alpha/beta fold hydrolase [Thiomonas bhubaneswarensis]CUA98152.1 Alpha/beta hydrolase family [Thiomonas bhubaneswarensis]
MPRSRLVSSVLPTVLPWMATPPLRPLLHWGLRRSLRAPRLAHTRSPADLGLAFTTARIATANGKTLHAWLIPPPASAARPAPAMVVVHGWGSNADLMLPLAPALHQAGLALLFIDARCHGASDGDTFASLPRFAEDTVHAVDWLAARPDIDPRRIALLGHSVGAGAVLLAASWRTQIAAVVSLAAFAHPAEMMQRWMAEQNLPSEVIGPLVLRYVQRTIGYRFDAIAPINTLPQLRCPVLLMHGEDDTVVPVTDAHRLMAVADSSRVQLHIGPGGHDSMEAFLSVIDRVSRFLAAHVRNTISQSEISGRPQ